MIKKLTPASITTQKRWAGFLPATKKGLLKKLQDFDNDSVPNKYDCKPTNRRRQESFDPVDVKYLSGKSEVKIGKKIDAGSYGSFHNIQGNKRLGVKVPHCNANNDDENPCEHCTNKEDILDELKLCENYNDKPLLMASKAITVDRKGLKCIGIARPIVTPVSWRNGTVLTDAQLESVRVALISLTRDSIALKDGIQCGFTTSGKMLQFDLGHVRKSTQSNALFHNSAAWNTLLTNAGKFSTCDALPTDSGWRMCVKGVYAKYGRVE
jgi:hypothetical protein